jgi:3-hydroxyacyl-[acyl-carrier-protein] dehydratase
MAHCHSTDHIQKTSTKKNPIPGSICDLAVSLNTMQASIICCHPTTQAGMSTSKPFTSSKALGSTTGTGLMYSGVANRTRTRTSILTRAEGAAAAPSEARIEKSGPNMKALKDIQEIMDILPHRYPFLLVDRVLEWEYGKYAVGYKYVTVNDNFFPGHFPQRAIMPGVLQVEAMAQLGGIVMIDPSDAKQQNNFFFGGVDNVRWRKPVVPGDVLMMRVEVTKFNKRFGICKMDAKAYVGEELVCEGELTLVMGQ